MSQALDPWCSAVERVQDVGHAAATTRRPMLPVAPTTSTCVGRWLMS